MKIGSQEMNKIFLAFLIFKNKLELKYLPRTATDKELEEQAEEGRGQLKQYSRDKKVTTISEGTALHCILLQFKGWELIKCEEVSPKC